MDDTDTQDCPVSLDVLGQLFRADPAHVADMTRGLAPDVRVRLALFCYGRQHLRDVGLTIAAHCDPGALAHAAGVSGQVLAAQSRARVAQFGRGDVRHVPQRAKVTLAGVRAA